jgi:hypothetical protein
MPEFKLPLQNGEYIFFTDPKDDWKGYMYICLSNGNDIIGSFKESGAYMVKELQRLRYTGKIVFGDQFGRSACPLDPDGPQRKLTEEQFILLEKAIEEFLASNKVDWVVRIFDECGEEMIEFRKLLENLTYAEAEEAADEYENECYEQNSTVDWHEMDHNTF